MRKGYGLILQVGDTIRTARIERGFTLRSLAVGLGIAPSYMSDIERDLRTPTERVLRGVSEALDVDFDLLMRQAGRMRGSVYRYVFEEEVAWQIVNRMGAARLEQEDLEEILRIVEEVAKRREERRDADSTEN